MRTSRPSGSHGRRSSVTRRAYRGVRSDRPAYARRAVISTDDARQFARRAIGSWRRRRGTTPPAADRTGFYAAGDPGAGSAGRGAGDRADAGARRGDRLAGALPHARRRRTARSRHRWPSPRPPGLAPTPRPVVAWVHGAVGVGAGCGPSRTGFEAWYARAVAARRGRRRRPRPHRPRRRGHRSTRTSTARRPAGPCSTPSGPRPTCTVTGAGARRRPGRPLGRRARRAVGQRAGGRPTTAPASTSASPCRCRRSVIWPSPWPTTRRPSDRPRSRSSWRRRGPTSSRSSPARRSRRPPWPDSTTWARSVSTGWSACSPATPARWVRARRVLPPARGPPRSSGNRPAASRAPRPSSSSRAMPTTPCSPPGPATWRRRWRATGVDVELRTYPGADHMAIADAAADDVVTALLDALRPR